MNGLGFNHPMRRAIWLMALVCIGLSMRVYTKQGDRTMPTAKEDAETLMNGAIEFAEQMLVKHGEFIPFGRAMTPDGEIVAVAGDVGDEQPQSQEVIGLLKQAFQQAARTGDYKATAIVYDVKVTLPENGSKSDAIAFQLDHYNNYSVVVLVPYTLSSGRVEYGETFAQQGADEVFGAPKL